MGSPPKCLLDIWVGFQGQHALAGPVWGAPAEPGVAGPARLSVGLRHGQAFKIKTFQPCHTGSTFFSGSIMGSIWSQGTEPDGVVVWRRHECTDTAANRIALG